MNYFIITAIVALAAAKAKAQAENNLNGRQPEVIFEGSIKPPVNGTPKNTEIIALHRLRGKMDLAAPNRANPVLFDEKHLRRQVRF